ncbi:MAG: hydrogen peroxide-inducible genes activator [Pseudomonadota bacterium]
MDASVTLRQLRYFIALTETGNFRKAADREGISQPSLSQQIARLEETLGISLIERGKRGAILTPGARVVLEHARKIMDEVAALQVGATAARDGIGGTLRLGSSPTLGPYFLPYLTRRLHQAYPELKLIIREAAPIVLQEDLQEGRYDLILTQLPVRSDDIAVERLFREPLRLAVSQDHELAKLSEVTDRHLAGQDVLALSSAYVLHTQISALCEEVGANLRREYEGTSLDALRQMTALNMGLTFLPTLYVRSEVSEETGDVAVLRFRRDRFTRSIGLAWRKRSAHREAIARIASAAKDIARDRFKGLVIVE